jgi:hypothetical protein
MNKPLGIKAYGSIPHLPGSRLGPGDRTINEGQARICLEKCHPDYQVEVQVKLDGTCVSVARIDGKLVCLNRKGYDIDTSDNVNHWLFQDWVDENQRLFSDLKEGERYVGEWLAQAHGTKYRLSQAPNGLPPFVVFDKMIGHERLDFWWLASPPIQLHAKPLSTSEAWWRAVKWHHTLAQPGLPEGVIYRVTKRGKFCFIAKWVRPDFEPGCLTKTDPSEWIWNYAERRAKRYLKLQGKPNERIEN